MLISHALIMLVAFFHLYFMYLEMFLWTKPKGLKIFGMSAEQALQSKSLAFNQGLYNGFLALALIWGVVQGIQDMQLYGLICVILAGLIGGMSVSRKVFFVQALPAIVALIVFVRVQLQ